MSGGVENSSSALISPELIDAALSCTALTRARNLAEWVGQGKTLTASGVLRPAEAVQACRDLGIELPGPRLRSALDVEDLMQDWATAAAAGFLEMGGRHVRAAEDLPDAGASTHPDQDAILHAWVQAATIVLDLDDQPCAGCLTVLNELYSADGPLTMGQLASAVRALEPQEPEGLPCPGCGEVHGPGDLLGFGDFLGDEYEDDASHATDTVTGLLWFGAVDVADEAVQLTPLGTMLAASVFQGREPSPDANAATVMSAVSELPPTVARTVAQPWLGARSATDAVRELLAFAESADGGQRVAALALAGELGSDAADAWREWAKRPGLGAYARQWLRSQGEQVPEDPADEAWLAVDGLSVMLDALADTVPPFLIQAMLAQEFGEEVTEVAEQMLRSGHPRAPDIAARLTGRPALAATRGSAVRRGSPSARQSQPGRSGVTGRSSGERKRRRGPGTLVYQLKITLSGVSRPPVWRRVLVPADVTLADLHEVIQQAMGWDDYHMHLFSVGGQEYGSPDPELGHASDRNVLLSQVLTSPGDRLNYTYDFGDDWEHDIVLEETRSAGPEETYPSCVAGKSACPPEDCGGVWGYAELKEILADPSHEGHQDMLEWLGLDAGKDFDPKEFSVADVNARLSPLSKAWSGS